MSEKDQYKNRIELLQGTLDMLILQTLLKAHPSLSLSLSRAIDHARFRTSGIKTAQLKNVFDVWHFFSLESTTYHVAAACQTSFVALACVSFTWWKIKPVTKGLLGFVYALDPFPGY